MSTYKSALARTHRIAWALKHGPIPKGMLVLHRCDNRRCINTDHLYLGTSKDNSRDLMERGKPFCFRLREYFTQAVEAHRVSRLPRGAKHHRSGAKLTPEQALAVYNAKGPQTEIARKFGICQQAVSRIKIKQTWKHLHEQA